MGSIVGPKRSASALEIGGGGGGLCRDAFRWMRAIISFRPKSPVSIAGFFVGGAALRGVTLAGDLGLAGAELAPS